jgi:ATP-dependent RNA helicase RhlE
LKNPEIIEIGVRRSPAETVTHAMYPVSTSQKYELLLALLESVEYNSVLIFTRTKIDADRIAHRLKADQHAVCVLHSSRTQTERFDALEGFKSGRYEVMVATDLAARGLDVSGISHVVNYDVPLHAEDYVHRIGRTGRAMTTGDAFTIMTAEDVLYVQAIERFIGASIPRSKLAGFNYTYTTLLEDEEKASNTMRRGASPKGRRRRR